MKVKDLSAYILLVSGKSPVKCRYSILNPLISACLAIIELLYGANDMDFGQGRTELIRQAKAKLKTMGFSCFPSNESACRKQKGTDLARHRLRAFLTSMHRKHGKSFYALSLDILRNAERQDEGRR